MYNKTQGFGFEIIDGKCVLSANENSLSRYKYIYNLANKSNLKCIPLKNISEPVYLLKAFEIKAENLTLLKLSNGVNELYNSSNGTILVMLKYTLIFIETENMK